MQLMCLARLGHPAERQRLSRDSWLLRSPQHIRRTFDAGAYPLPDERERRVARVIENKQITRSVLVAL